MVINVMGSVHKPRRRYPNYAAIKGNPIWGYGELCF